MSNKNNCHKIRSRFIINPFMWFSFIWTIILLIHSMDVATIYPGTPSDLLVFFSLIIIASFILGFIYDKMFLKKRSIIYYVNDRPSILLTLVVAALFVAGCVYSQGIPLVDTLSGNSKAYSEFGIPFISFLGVCLTTVNTVLSSVKLIYGTKHKKANFLILLTCYLLPILSYSRGMLIFNFAITVLVILSEKKFKLKHFVAFILLIIIGALLFNISGNIRSGFKWNDSTFIVSISGFNSKYSNLKDFSWTLVYLDSPLGNLCYNYLNIPPKTGTGGLLSQLLPDFISKRLFPEYISKPYLVQPGLTVCSMFAGAYEYGGLLGMVISYIEYVIFVFFFASFECKNSKLFIATSASLSMISIMSFFNNMITYSGYSFFLFFFLINYFYETGKKKKNKVLMSVRSPS